MPDQASLSTMYRERSEFVLSRDFLDARKHARPLEIAPCSIEHVDTGNPRNAPCLELTRPSRVNYLEIGCGEGQMLRYFLGKGAVCYGVEPGTWVRHDSIVSDIAEIPREAKFDVIVIYDVLEHLADPLLMLSTCRAMTNEGARIYCAFPNKDSLAARLLRQKWLMVRPLGHLHYFSRRSAATLFTRAGWMPTRFQRLPRCDLRACKGSLRAMAWTVLNHGDQWLVHGVTT